MIETIFHSVLVGAGLAVFEIISSIDNAVVNASILATMKSRRARIAFFFFGGFVAVFLVRGLLPFAIFYAANAGAGMQLGGAWAAIWGAGPAVQSSVAAAAPILLMGGGEFLVLLFARWLFLEEEKHFGFIIEKKFLEIGQVWFSVIVSLTLVVGLWLIKTHMDPAFGMNVAFSFVLGSMVFFIVDSFKVNAERAEERILASGRSQTSDWSKVLFLTIIDATFSIDGVVGAFAFTMQVPMILVGNGIGALVVMYLTIHNVERIQSYQLLENGAMYSIGCLGLLMMSEAFGLHVPEWVSPVITFSFLGYFLWRSVKLNREMALRPERG